ncbi:hypothetical protein [Flavobacterium ustbae]|uniref:hypothetical protein n=1 Tax=Flavobacterium ustbae TaxID=2488790 RepID=UPI000F77CBE0|nr:hypothetical protein [Flavobacterium ustbae]
MKNKIINFSLFQRLLLTSQYAVIVLLVMLVFSCAGKIYMKEDYTFYNSNFRLDQSASLRTDGVYVLQSIWTAENGGILKQPKDHRFYKFYATGQCNLSLDSSFEIKTEKDYADAVSKDFLMQKNTLFQGYYKLSADRIAIESRVVPRHQFEYKYGYVKKDSLIIVKAGNSKKGTFDDSNFPEYYKEYYVFKPLALPNENQPQW